MSDRRKFVVMTDSACDMPLDLEKESGVDILKFQINVDGKDYVERDDFTFSEYFDMMRNCKDIPITSHITAPRFLEQFEKYDAAGMEQVLYVTINGSGSATADAAQMGLSMFREEHPQSKMEVYIVDSHTYSMAYGWFVAEAARKLTNGAEMQDVIEWLEDNLSRVEIVLAAYSLRFMKKSGRVSAAAAFAGELLGLRPVVTLIDGKSVVRQKVRGDAGVPAALLKYAEEHMDDTKTYMVGGTDMKGIEELATMCEKKWKAKSLCNFELGSAVSTNTGPDTIAIVYLGEKRER